MRVVHFGYADELPGAARASYRLHRALSTSGVDSWMVVGLRVGDDERVVGPAPGVETLVARSSQRVDALLTRALTGDLPERSAALAGTRLVRRVLALRPDVVQLHWLGGGLVRPAGLRALASLPIVWRLADEWALHGLAHYEPAGLSAWQTRFERLAVGRKRRAFTSLPRLTVVTPTTWLAERVAESDTLGNRRVEVIPTGVDLGTWSPGDRDAARHSLGLPPDAPVVLFGASRAGVNPRKGWDLLLAAVRRLDPSYRLAAFGEAEVPDDLRSRYSDLGHIDDERRLVEAYRAADVFVAPSRQENLANTGIEALACGTPVVCFGVGGMRELVEHGVSGWLASPFDPEDLAAGIGWAIDPARRAEARRRAEDRFDARVQAARYAELYADVVGGAG